MMMSIRCMFVRFFNHLDDSFGSGRGGILVLSLLVV